MGKRELRSDEIITELRVYIARNFNGKQKAFAKSMGVSSAFVSSVMNGKKPPSDQMLKQIGFSKEVEVKFLRLDEAQATR
jgi:transcriptional regulator with XRE-family HTH domain